MKVYSIQNKKGGVAKTQTALNLAYYLSQHGKKVLLVDNDPQANTTKIVLKPKEKGGKDNALKLVEKYNKTGKELLESCNVLHNYVMQTPFEKDISDIYLDPKIIKQTIQHTQYDTLDIVPSSNRLSVVDTQIKMSGRNPSGRLRQAFNQIQNDYDVAIIDNSPFENALTYNAMCSCYKEGDTIIIPIKIDESGLEGLDATLNTLFDWLETEQLDYDFKILVTMANRNNVDKEWTNTLKELFKERVYDTTIRYQSKPVVDCSTKKEILIEKSKENVANDYREFCKEVLNQF